MYGQASRYEETGKCRVLSEAKATRPLRSHRLPWHSFKKVLSKNFWRWWWCYDCYYFCCFFSQQRRMIHYSSPLFLICRTQKKKKMKEMRTEEEKVLMIVMLYDCLQILLRFGILTKHISRIFFHNHLYAVLTWWWLLCCTNNITIKLKSIISCSWWRDRSSVYKTLSSIRNEQLKNSFCSFICLAWRLWIHHFGETVLGN